MHNTQFPSHLVSFFSAEILAVYRSQPDRYRVETDYFSRHVNDTGQDAAENSISILFGF